MLGMSFVCCSTYCQVLLSNNHCILLTDVKDDDGDSPLDVAMRWDELRIAFYLISCGCDSNEDKVKVFTKACQSGELEVVKELVQLCNAHPKGMTFFHV